MVTGECDKRLESCENILLTLPSVLGKSVTSSTASPSVLRPGSCVGAVHAGASQLVVHVYFQKIDLIQVRNSCSKRIVPRCQRSSKKLETRTPAVARVHWCLTVLPPDGRTAAAAAAAAAASGAGGCERVTLLLLL